MYSWFGLPKVVKKNEVVKIVNRSTWRPGILKPIPVRGPFQIIEIQVLTFCLQLLYYLHSNFLEDTPLQMLELDSTALLDHRSILPCLICR